MKVTIAGTNGLAWWIAHYLSMQSFHRFEIFSRAPKPAMTDNRWNVTLVNYNNEADLTFRLVGTDLVISMVTGDDQLLLIDAALKAGVARFVPAEFSGMPSKRPSELDPGMKKAMALNRLRDHVEEGMRFTVFICGIFYERFGPNGLAGANTGHVSGNNSEGDFLMNVRTMRSLIPHDSSGAPAMMCMISMHDVARFIVEALNLPPHLWQQEFRLRGERLDASTVVRIAERFRDRVFERAEHRAETLQASLQLAQATGDVNQQLRTRTLMAAAAGAYDFADANLNRLVSIQPMSFQEWLGMVWEGLL